MADFFRRVEKKYIITQSQYSYIKKAISDKMQEDSYGKSTICNIYFDTENYDLIKNSITKPIYKDKIRLRSYNVPEKESIVYLEVKRKFKEIVSKRRIEIKLSEFEKIENREIGKLQLEENSNSQIQKELEYYFNHYNLISTMYISYQREAYYEKENMNFRLTFDSEVLARENDLQLDKGSYGTYILEEDKYIMEIKTLDAIPLWFVSILNKIDAHPCGFSKYGEAYTQLILKANKIAEYVI
jgi:SPX domain protein involved in polyphosphate accumulation